MPYIALIFQRKGLSMTEIGIVVGWQFVINFFFRLVTSGVADKYHKHKQMLLVISVITAVFMCAIYWVPQRDQGNSTENKPLFVCERDVENDTVVSCNGQNDTAGMNLEVEFSQGPNNQGEGHNASLVLECKHFEKMDFCSSVQNFTKQPKSIEVRMEGQTNSTCTIDCLGPDHKGLKVDSIFWKVFWFWCVTVNCYGALWGLLYGMNYDVLGGNKLHFGRQRLWGTFGSIITAVIAAFSMNEYGSKKTEVNYVPCFIGYTICIIATGIIGLFFRLEYKVKQPKLTMKIFQLFKQPQLVLLFSMICIMGFLFGAINAFMFVFLRKLNASSWVLGAALFIRFSSEVPTLYFTGTILKKIGYAVCVYLALLLNCIIYVSTSFMTNPWWELPLSALKSFTFSLGFMALSIHTSSITPPAMNATLQALVQTLHFGVGEQMLFFLLIPFVIALTFDCGTPEQDVTFILLSAHYCCFLFSRK